jgi:hypothetical protein
VLGRGMRRLDREGEGEGVRLWGLVVVFHFGGLDCV